MAKIENNATGNELESGAEGATESTGSVMLGNLLDKDNLKTLRGAIGGDRVYFETTTTKDADGNDVIKTAFEQASAAIESASAKTNQFYGLPLIVQAEIDSRDRICIATLGKRDKATSTNGVQAILAYYVPAAAEFITNEAADDFVSKLIERESSDVIFTRLRGLDTLAQLETAFGGIPTTVEAIVSQQRESRGVDTDAFDSIWASFKSGYLKEKAPAVFANLPPRQEVIKAMRSASFALISGNPKTVALEERGFFAKMLTAMIALAPKMVATDESGKSVPAPVDPASLQEWLDTRNEVHLDGPKEETFDPNALDAKMDF